jgi:hypothetical protein
MFKNKEVRVRVVPTNYQDNSLAKPNPSLSVTQISVMINEKIVFIAIVAASMMALKYFLETISHLILKI